MVMGSPGKPLAVGQLAFGVMGLFPYDPGLVSQGGLQKVAAAVMPAPDPLSRPRFAAELNLQHDLSIPMYSFGSVRLRPWAPHAKPVSNTFTRNRMSIWHTLVHEEAHSRHWCALK